MADTHASPALEPWTDRDEAAWQQMRGGSFSPPMLPPSDDRLEQRLLGILIVASCPLPRELYPWEFVDPVHAVIFDAMHGCRATGQPIDDQSLTARLNNEPRMEEVGGTAYLGQLRAMAGDPTEQTSDFVERAAVTISELAHTRDLLMRVDELRQLIKAHEEIIRDPAGDGRRHARGCGRNAAHALAMDLTGLARDVLDRSLGWA